MHVELIHPHSQKEVLEILYTAYRVCYSAKPISEIRTDIESGEISEQQIKSFIKRMLKTGHTSPLRQIHFVFVIEGVSRVLTAQFNRHTIGVDRCEMSQRYIKIDGKNKPCIIPESISKCKIDNNYPDDNALEIFKENIECCYDDYDSLIGFYEIPQEDARYGLPMGTESREQVSFSFEALQNYLDVRMCSKTQLEHRKLAWAIYKLMRKRFPLLSSSLGIKCWENRKGYCDEIKKCEKWGCKRPSKQELMKMWRKRDVELV